MVAMKEKYFYQSDDDWIGPFEAKDIRKLAESKLIELTTIIKRQSDEKTFPAKRLTDCFRIFQKPQATKQAMTKQM